MTGNEANSDLGQNHVGRRHEISDSLELSVSSEVTHFSQLAVCPLHLLESSIETLALQDNRFLYPNLPLPPILGTR